MRVLVTGGAGFIGSHIADALLERGHEVAVFDDLSTGSKRNVPQTATFIEGDVRDADSVERVLTDVRPDVICHQAAQTSVSVSVREPVRDAETNIVGSLHLLEGAVRHRIERFVFASTGGAIYGEVPDGERADAAWPTRPLSPYGCAKLSVENYLRAYGAEHGLRATALRYANVYGPRQDPHGEAGVVAIFCRRLLERQPLQINARKEAGDEGCVRDYVFVADVVHANVEAIEGGLEAPVANVGTGVGTTTLELANALARVIGVEPEIRFGSRRAGDLERSVLEPERAFRAAGSVELADGLSRTVAWFRESDG